MEVLSYSVLCCSECVECLLEHNAKVLVHDNITKRSVLHVAGNCCLSL